MIRSRSISLETAMLERVPLKANVPPGHVEYEKLLKCFEDHIRDRETALEISMSYDLTLICDRLLGQQIPFDQKIKETAIEERDIDAIRAELSDLLEQSRARRIQATTPLEDRKLLYDRERDLSNASDLLYRWNLGVTFELLPFSEEPINFLCFATEVYGDDAVVWRARFMPLSMGNMNCMGKVDTVRLHRLHLAPVDHEAFRWEKHEK